MTRIMGGRSGFRVFWLAAPDRISYYLNARKPEGRSFVYQSPRSGGSRLGQAGNAVGHFLQALGWIAKLFLATYVIIVERCLYISSRCGNSCVAKFGSQKGPRRHSGISVTKVENRGVLNQKHEPLSRSAGAFRLS